MINEVNFKYWEFDSRVWSYDTGLKDVRTVLKKIV